MKNTNLIGLISLGMSVLADQTISYEARKELLLNRWDASKLMPRKMKKRVRREVKLDWSINEWAGEQLQFV